MSVKSQLKYFGWSSFAIESANGTLIFDPLYRKMYGANWSNLNEFIDADIICLTHGHFDHYIDTPEILKQTDAVVVTSKDICNHLNTKYKVKKERLLPIKPFQEINVSNFKITAFEWGHREVSILRFLREGLLRAEFFSTFQFAWLNLLKVPFNAPCFGFYVELADNIKLMNYCEGFNDLMKIEKVRELSRRFKPDILLAGMQLNFEEQLSEGVAALSPKTVILFHPHEALFEKFGLKSSSPQMFAEKIKHKMPDVEVTIANPQQILTPSSSARRRIMN